MGQAKVKREKLARMQAVIDAAVQWRDSMPSIAAEVKLTAAVGDWLALVAATPPESDAPADLNAFRCPHCDAERPPYGWHFNIGDTGPFALQWITCFCGECKGVLGVSVVQFMPKQELVDQLKRQFSTKLVT